MKKEERRIYNKAYNEAQNGKNPLPFIKMTEEERRVRRAEAAKIKYQANKEKRRVERGEQSVELHEKKKKAMRDNYHAKKNSPERIAYREANKERKAAADKKLKNTPEYKEHTRQYNEANKEHTKARNMAYREANKEMLKENRAERYKTNPDPQKARTKAWQQKNPHKAAMLTRRYNLRSFMATPSWSETDQIQDLYLMRDTINDKYNLKGNESVQVDHIIPLQGKLVSGLHVIANLQLVDKAYNSSKGNR